MLTSKAVVHESIPSTNIPPPGRPRGFAPTFDPGTEILPSELPDGCRGSGLFYDILSSNLLVDATLRCYFSFKLIYQLLQFSSEKSVLELG